MLILGMTCFLVALQGTNLVAAEAGRPVPPVLVMTRQYIEKNQAARKARQEAGLARPPMDADAQALFDLYMTRLDEIFEVRESVEQTNAAPSVDDALNLVNLLYEDMTAPYLNGRWQDMAVDEIHFAASRPGVSDEVAGILRTGLVEYASAGGGLGSPFVEMNLATALTVLGGPNHPECDELASRLAAYAEGHADELNTAFYTRIVQRDSQRIDDIARKNYTSAAKLNKAWTEADQALRGMALSDDPSPAGVNRAVLLATVDFGDEAINEDMIARLLIAYRLRLENRKGLKRPVIAAIDKRLLWLAEKKTRKLTSKRHWTLWARAVGKIPRQVVSRDLHGFLRKGERAKEDRSLAKAAADAQGRLRRQ